MHGMTEPDDLGDLVAASRWRPTRYNQGVPRDVAAQRLRLGCLTRRARTHAGLGLCEAARRLGVRGRLLCQFERGETMPVDAIDRYLELIGWRVPVYPQSASA